VCSYVLCLCFCVFECSWFVFYTRYTHECACVVQCVRLSALSVFCAPHAMRRIVHERDGPAETEQHTIERILFLKSTATSRSSINHKNIN